MITPEKIQEAKAFLIDEWGEDGKVVIAECTRHPPLNMGVSRFFDYTLAQGGNWSGMLLTGIKKLRPAVWDTIPDDMGHNSFACLCYVLILCGVDTTE